jgi:hypothetical protein
MRYKRKSIYQTNPKQERFTPYQLRKNDLTLEARTAISLYVLCGFPQHLAYRIAFSVHGAASSVAPAASRWFAQREVQEYIALWAHYFFEKYYDVPSKILQTRI